MHSGRIPVAPGYSEGGELSGSYSISTDEFVTETATVYEIASDPLRLSGHPYHQVDETIPFISPSRFTVFRLQLPDYNKFHLPERAGKISLESEVFVWKLVGLRVDSQGPIAVATTGITHSGVFPTDAGAPLVTPVGSDSDDEDDDYKYRTWGLEHKQRQLLTAGCKPLDLVTEGISIPTGADQDDPQKPVLVRTVEPCQDGMLCEFGYGNKIPDVDHDDWSTPVEMQTHRTYIPDLMGMSADKIGDKCFFHVERDAVGIRHTGFVEKLDSGDPTKVPKAHITPDPWRAVTAGMASSQLDIFNRNYWLNKARGPNNGMCWDNKLYVTVVDNMRGFIHRTVLFKNGQSKGSEDKYEPNKLEYFARHVKELKVTALVRLCKVKLEAKLVTYLLRMNSEWLSNFGFQFHHAENQMPYGQFRVPNQQDDDREQNVSSAHSGGAIDIDCVGGLTFPHHSDSHLSREYTALNGAPAAPKGRRKK